MPNRLVAPWRRFGNALLLPLDFALFAAGEHVNRAPHLALLLAERAEAREGGDG